MYIEPHMIKDWKLKFNKFDNCSKVNHKLIIYTYIYMYATNFFCL